MATALPYTPIGSLLRFTPLPVSLLGAIAFLALTYLFLVQAVKTWFYRATRCFETCPLKG
jgi:P-type Mg2+ transporter